MKNLILNVEKFFHGKCRRKHGVNQEFSPYRLIAVMVVAFILAMSSISEGRSQATEKATPRLDQGIELFYMAQFESAIQVLRETLLEDSLSASQRFDAYVYIGFSLIRLDADPELVDKSFLQAIKAEPQKDLDRLRIPPDLLARFELVKANMRGAILIQTEPPDALALVLNQEYNIELTDITPAVFKDLVVGQYEVLIARDKYVSESINVLNHPGVIDTVRVELIKKPKPFYLRWWVWGGGVALATAYAIIRDEDGSWKPPDLETLPPPPDRPMR